MNFGSILTDLELFIGRVPERAKTIIINMGIKIPLIFDIRPEFLICCRGSPTLIHLLKSEEKKNAEMKITNVKFE